MHKYYNKDYYPKIGEDALPWFSRYIGKELKEIDIF